MAVLHYRMLLLSVFIISLGQDPFSLTSESCTLTPDTHTVTFNGARYTELFIFKSIKMLYTT
jgi:hypothetical protein